MHFANLANGNSREARCIYAETYPQCNLLCRKIFTNIHRYLRKKNSFVKNTINLGKLMTVRTSILEQAVLTNRSIQKGA